MDSKFITGAIDGKFVWDVFVQRYGLFDWRVSELAFNKGKKIWDVEETFLFKASAERHSRHMNNLLSEAFGENHG